MKIEKDAAAVTAGVRHGRTMGGPIALQVANRDYKNWEERMNPWPVEADVPGGAPAAPRARRPGGRAEVRVHRRAQRAGTGLRARDRRARRRRSAGQGVPAGARRRGALARDPDRDGAGAAGADLRARRLRRGRREPGPLPRRRRLEGDGRRDQRAAQEERVDRRDLRAAGVRARARPRVARLLAAAARRRDRRRAALDPGRQGRRARRRVRPRRPPGLRGPRRDLLLRGARVLPRDQPLRRARGRHDDRRAAGRARGDEADPDPDQAAALRGHLHPRTRPGPARAHRLLRRPRRGRRGGGDAGDRARRRLPGQVRRRPHRRRARPRWRRTVERIGWKPRL